MTELKIFELNIHLFIRVMKLRYIDHSLLLNSLLVQEEVKNIIILRYLTECPWIRRMKRD